MGGFGSGSRGKSKKSFYFTTSIEKADLYGGATTSAVSAALTGLVTRMAGAH